MEPVFIIINLHILEIIKYKMVNSKFSNVFQIFLILKAGLLQVKIRILVSMSNIWLEFNLTSSGLAYLVSSDFYQSSRWHPLEVTFCLYGFSTWSFLILRPNHVKAQSKEESVIWNTNKICLIASYYILDSLNCSFRSTK